MAWHGTARSVKHHQCMLCIEGSESLCRGSDASQKILVCGGHYSHHAVEHCRPQKLLVPAQASNHSNPLNDHRIRDKAPQKSHAVQGGHPRCQATQQCRGRLRPPSVQATCQHNPLKDPAPTTCMARHLKTHTLCREGITDTKLFSDAEDTPPAGGAEGSPEAPPGAAMFSRGAREAPRGSLGEQAAPLAPAIQDLKLVREGDEAKAEEEKRLRLRKVSDFWSDEWKQGIDGCRAQLSKLTSAVTGSWEAELRLREACCQQTCTWG